MIHDYIILYILFFHRIGKTVNEPSLRLGAAGHASKRWCPPISDSDPYSSLSFSPVFVAATTKSQVTTESFLKLMGSLRPRKGNQQKAFDYFRDFIIYLGGWLAY